MFVNSNSPGQGKTYPKICINFVAFSFKAGKHVGTVGLVCSTRRLSSVAVCPIQHAESESGVSARGRTLIGCSV